MMILSDKILIALLVNVEPENAEVGYQQLINWLSFYSENDKLVNVFFLNTTLLTYDISLYKNVNLFICANVLQAKTKFSLKLQSMNMMDIALFVKNANISYVIHGR